MSEEARLAAAYWATSIIDIEPGRIHLRGYPIEELIGRISFPQVIWLMLRGELPSPGEVTLLEAALVASVDHGPQAPSIAVARMAVTCGLPLNGAMASAVNMLDDVHGGAGQQTVELLHEIAALNDRGATLDAAADAALARFIEARGKYVPGFGHRFHPIDPRAGRLLELVDQAVAAGCVTGRFVTIARAIVAALYRRKGRTIPMNIDGATAVIYAELGFAPALARGIFCLSRSVGILAHAWEQSGRSERNKGPMPRQLAYAYTGAATRHLNDEPAKVSERSGD